MGYIANSDLEPAILLLDLLGSEAGLPCETVRVILLLMSDSRFIDCISVDQSADPIGTPPALLVGVKSTFRVVPPSGYHARLPSELLREVSRRAVTHEVSIRIDTVAWRWAESRSTDGGQQADGVRRGAGVACRCTGIGRGL